MYRKSFEGEDQLSLELGSFNNPFSKHLDPENRWVKLSRLIPWEKFEKQYSDKFRLVGRQTYPFRMTLGALLIETKLSITDRELVEQISENPYLQYFLGMPEYSNRCPFDDSTVTHFRKRRIVSLCKPHVRPIIRGKAAEGGAGGSNKISPITSDSKVYDSTTGGSDKRQSEDSKNDNQKPPWLPIAREEIGVQEIPGPRNNPRIIQYDASTTLKATSDAVAWCSAYANWVMQQAGYKGTQSARALDWLNWKEGALIDKPAYGCIGVIEKKPFRGLW